MPDINTNLQRLTNDSNEIESLVGDITNAIAENGGTVSPSGGLRGFPAAIGTIIPPINSVIENELITYETIMNSGGITPTPVPAGTVRFIDYDGTVIASYGALTFLSLTELPANPTHEGLTSQGWNWSLADAKDYVTANGSLNIGQMYVTSDGKTRIYITLTEGRISPILQLYLNANTTLDIDWGDGSTHSTFTSTSDDYVSERHNYATAGDYVIAISVTTGSFVLQSSSSNVSSILWNGNNIASSPDRAYNNSIQKIEIGTGVNSIGNNAFNYCFSLSFITIPDGVTSIGSYAFNSCYALTSITIPDGVTSIGGSAFQYCYALTSITIPDGVTSIGSSAFYECCSLPYITIPGSVTSIGEYALSGCRVLTSITIPDSVNSIGNRSFQNCYSLTSITIPDSVTSIGERTFQSCYALPSITISNSVTSIDQYAFYYCYSLSSFTIPNGVTSIGKFAFEYCYSLQSITIPDTVTSIGQSAFQNCFSLSSITIPEGVTSIGQNAFSSCYSLSSVTIPDTVTTIGNNAFSGCTSLSSITIGNSVTSIGNQAFSCTYMESIKFKSTTPPTVSNSNVWYELPTTCIIYVPTGTLTAYTSATNYPSSSTYTYIEY